MSNEGMKKSRAAHAHAQGNTAAGTNTTTTIVSYNLSLPNLVTHHWRRRSRKENVEGVKKLIFVFLVLQSIGQKLVHLCDLGRHA